MPRLTVLVLVALALALAACGGDDSGAGAPERGATSGEGVAPTGPEGAAPRAEEDGSDLNLERNQEPVPEGSVPPEERTGKPPRYTRQTPIPKDQLEAIERPIFEQSRYLCKRLGVEGMRREYRIESSDPQDVAQEVAKRTYQADVRDAVYSGCLAGLRSGN
jgi:hypothetical protein